jgi:hypothetical protein
MVYGILGTDVTRPQMRERWLGCLFHLLFIRVQFTSIPNNLEECTVYLYLLYHFEAPLHSNHSRAPEHPVIVCRGSQILRALVSLPHALESRVMRGCFALCMRSQLSGLRTRQAFTLTPTTLGRQPCPKNRPRDAPQPRHILPFPTPLTPDSPHLYMAGDLNKETAPQIVFLAAT